MAKLIGDTIRSAAAREPDSLAATLGAEAVSFGALDRQATRLAHALRGIGVRSGELVAWWSGPALHNLTGMLACARVGAVFAPMSPLLSRQEAHVMLDYIDPRLLVCDGERIDAGQTIAGETLATIGAGATGARHDLDAMCETAPDTPVQTPELRDREPHILYLTSGSTGQPKGVLVSHRASWLRSCPQAGESGAAVRGVLCTFPLYHYGGWHYVLEAWLRRTTVHLVSKADGPHIVDAVERHRPEAIYCIPAVWDRVLAEPGDLGSIRHADTGTSAVAEDLLARIAERLPQARTRILYGASEAGRMAALDHADLADHPGSVGRAIPTGRIEIADDGEILFSGQTVMNGYLRQEEQTAQALRRGWYRTGDLGFIDGDGFLHISGRIREIIRTGGEWVSPLEVEDALGPLPGVRDIAVVGLPDPRWGEIVCAAVVPVDGMTAPTAEALRFLVRELAPHKHPRVVAAVAEIPRTAATGQVMRAALREAVLDQLSQPRADACAECP